MFRYVFLSNKPFHSRHDTKSLGDRGLHKKEPGPGILSLAWMVYVKTSHLFNCEMEITIPLVQITMNEITFILDSLLSELKTPSKPTVAATTCE